MWGKGKGKNAVLLCTELLIQGTHNPIYISYKVFLHFYLPVRQWSLKHITCTFRLGTQCGQFAGIRICLNLKRMGQRQKVVLVEIYEDCGSIKLCQRYTWTREKKTRCFAALQLNGCKRNSVPSYNSGSLSEMNYYFTTFTWMQADKRNNMQPFVLHYLTWCYSDSRALIILI